MFSRGEQIAIAAMMIFGVTVSFYRAWRYGRWYAGRARRIADEDREAKDRDL